MIFGVAVKDLTASALVGIAVMLVFFGYLIPRRIYKDKSDESDRWRLAFEIEREARATSDAQTATLLEGQKTMFHLVEAIFKNSEIVRKGGEDLAIP